MDRTSLLSLGMVVAVAGVLGAAEIHVPGDHVTIQQAIDSADDGDRILVAPGTYAGFSIVDRHLDIEGQDPNDAPHLEGQSGQVAIDGSRIKLRNLSFEFDASFHGLYAMNSNVAMEDCSLWHHGLLVYGSSEGWNGGMHFQNCPSIILKNCISHGRDGEGEPFPGAGAGGGVWGLYVDNGGTVILENCEFEGGDGGGSLPVQGGGGPDGPGGDGALLRNCTEVTIIGCSFTPGLGEPDGRGLVLEDHTTGYIDADSSSPSTSVDATSVLSTRNASSSVGWWHYQ